MDTIEPGKTRALCIQKYASNSELELTLSVGDKVVIKSMKNVQKNGFCLVEFQNMEGFCPFSHFSVFVEDDDEETTDDEFHSCSEGEMDSRFQNVLKSDAQRAPPPPPLTDFEQDQSQKILISNLQEGIMNMKLKPASETTKYDEKAQLNSTKKLKNPILTEFQQKLSNRDSNYQNNIEERIKIKRQQQHPVLGELQLKLLSRDTNSQNHIEERIKAKRQQQQKDNELQSVPEFTLKKVKKMALAPKEVQKEEPENPLKFLKNRKRKPLLQLNPLTKSNEANELERKLSRRKSLNGEDDLRTCGLRESSDILSNFSKTSQNHFLNDKLQKLTIQEEELPPPPPDFLNCNDYMDGDCALLLPPPPLETAAFEKDNKQKSFPPKPASKTKAYSNRTLSVLQNSNKRVTMAALENSVVMAPPPPPPPTQKFYPQIIESRKPEDLTPKALQTINISVNRSNFLNSIKGFDRQSLRPLPKAEHSNQSRATPIVCSNGIEMTLKARLYNYLASRRLHLADDSDHEDNLDTKDNEMDEWDGEE